MREYTRWAFPVWFICTTVLDLVPCTPAGMLHGRAGARCPRSRRPRRRRGWSVFLEGRGRGGNDRLAAVVAVGGDVVADGGLAGGRIGRQLLGAQLVMRAALATAGGG